MDFSFRPLAIPDVVLVRPDRHEDARGSFTETFRRSAFAEAGVDVEFVQDNMTRSGRGVLRGLHYQRPPAPQGKLVGVIRGAIYDVAVDLRASSATYGRWVARELDAAAGEMLWIPPGFAHGYCIVSDGADVSYKVTAEYRAELSCGIAWDDPALAIPWPVDVPILSQADRAQPALADVESPFP